MSTAAKEDRLNGNNSLVDNDADLVTLLLGEQFLDAICKAVRDELQAHDLSNTSEGAAAVKPQPRGCSFVEWIWRFLRSPNKEDCK